jgi:hypothetical protein
LKQIHLNWRWLEIYVRIGGRNDAARFEFKLYRVASRHRMSALREDLAKRLASSFKRVSEEPWAPGPGGMGGQPASDGCGSPPR